MYIYVYVVESVTENPEWGIWIRISCRYTSHFLGWCVDPCRLGWLVGAWSIFFFLRFFFFVSIWLGTALGYLNGVRINRHWWRSVWQALPFILDVPPILLAGTSSSRGCAEQQQQILNLGFCLSLSLRNVLDRGGETRRGILFNPHTRCRILFFL